MKIKDSDFYMIIDLIDTKINTLNLRAHILSAKGDNTTSEMVESHCLEYVELKSRLIFEKELAEKQIKETEEKHFENTKFEVFQLICMSSNNSLEDKEKVKDYIKHIFEINDIILSDSELEKVYNEIRLNYKMKKGD